MLGESYVITDGLTEGEEIVTNGTFSVDAAAQLAGKPSMMNGIQPVVSEGKQTSFRVSGNCDMCRERIEKAASSVSGVTSASWDSATQMITVGFESDRADIQTIEKAIAKVGHDTEHFRADDVTYKSLPECCLYRK
jgi:Cu(I)/Ag(I) efflux system membrane fusion protein